MIKEETGFPVRLPHGVLLHVAIYDTPVTVRAAAAQFDPHWLPKDAETGLDGCYQQDGKKYHVVRFARSALCLGLVAHESVHIAFRNPTLPIDEFEEDLAQRIEQVFKSLHAALTSRGLL